jgi:hypothetical protein
LQEAKDIMPFMLHNYSKKLFFLFGVYLLFFSVQWSYAEENIEKIKIANSMSFINSFDRVRLMPSAAIPTGCPQGTLFMDQIGVLHVCTLNGNSEIVGSPWKEDSNWAFPTSSEAINDIQLDVGSDGTDLMANRSIKFQVASSTGASSNRIFVRPFDGSGNMGVELITKGAPTTTNNSYAMLDFHIDQTKPLWDARIAYHFVPGLVTPENGIGIYVRSTTGVPAVNMATPDIWLDETNSNMQIGGTRAPLDASKKLIVLGDVNLSAPANNIVLGAGGPLVKSCVISAIPSQTGCYAGYAP